MIHMGDGCKFLRGGRGYSSIFSGSCVEAPGVGSFVFSTEILRGEVSVLLFLLYLLNENTPA